MATIEHAEQIRLQHRAKIFGEGVLATLSKTPMPALLMRISRPPIFFDCVRDQRLHPIVVSYIADIVQPLVPRPTNSTALAL